MNKLFKIIFTVLMLMPFLSQAQFIQYLGTKDNIVETRNISREDSGHEFAITDTLAHPSRVGRMISFHGQPWWWNGIRWFQLNGDTTTVPGQVNADWTAVSGVALILHKPTFATVATTGVYGDLTGKPTIPAAQVSSDWNAVSGVSQILNKPRITDSIWRVIGKDSILFRIIGSDGTVRNYSILDSAGGSGGSGGTVNNVTVGSLSPLFTSNTINPTSTPTTSFTLNNQANNSIFGNNVGSTGPPLFFVPNSTILNTWFGGAIQPAITFTTTGTGAATFVSNALNIPNNLQTIGYNQLATSNTLVLSVNSSTATLLPVTSSLAGLADTAMKHLTDSIHNGTKTFTIYALNGLSVLGVSGDSIGLGGTLYKNTSLSASNLFTVLFDSVSQGFFVKGLVTRSPISTDSMLIRDNTGRFWVTSVPSGGGGAVASVSNSDGTLTITPTTGAVVASLNLGRANVWTIGQTFPAITATSTVTMTGTTFAPSSLSSKLDGLVQDTVTGITYRRQAQFIDTTGASLGGQIVYFDVTANNFKLESLPFISTNYLGRDTITTITSGSSSTVPNGTNIIRFNPTTVISSYTLTLPTTWHSDNDLLIAFTANGTLTSGSTMITTLSIVNGSGQTLSQAIVPTTGQAGEVIRYHLTGTIDQRTN